MKNRISLFATLMVAVLFPSRSWSQGSLTPPGAPAPSMKTLSQIEPKTPISSVPFSITTPGSYYFTTNVIQTPGSTLSISASHVVLDLNGFSFIGTNSSTIGIFINGNITNLAVQNGTIRGWGKAIQGTSLRGGRFSRLNIFGNGGGIDVDSSALVEDCIVVDGGPSNFAINAGDNAQVIRCQTRGAYGGIVLGQNALVSDCVVSSNVADGIVIASGNVVNCTVTSSRAGIAVQTNGIISGCTTFSNTSHGIVVSNHCSVVNNTVQGNGTLGSHGGIILNGIGSRAEGNNIISNFNYGIRTAGTNLVIRNSARGNGLNYSFATGTTYGPINSTIGVITNLNPYANFEY